VGRTPWSAVGPLADLRSQADEALAGHGVRSAKHSPAPEFAGIPDIVVGLYDTVPNSLILRSPMVFLNRQAAVILYVAPGGQIRRFLSASFHNR
jgi:hypothetical protein